MKYDSVCRSESERDKGTFLITSSTLALRNNSWSIQVFSISQKFKAGPRVYKNLNAREKMIRI